MHPNKKSIIKLNVFCLHLITSQKIKAYEVFLLSITFKRVTWQQNKKIFSELKVRHVNIIDILTPVIFSHSSINESFDHSFLVNL